MIDPVQVGDGIAKMLENLKTPLTDDQKGAMTGALAVWLMKAQPFNTRELRYLLSCVERDPRITLASVHVVKEKLEKLLE